MHSVPRLGPIPPGAADDRQPAATQTLWQPHPPVAERQHRGRAVREAGAAQPDMQLGDHEVTYGKSTGQVVWHIVLAIMSAIWLLFLMDENNNQPHKFPQVVSG